MLILTLGVGTTFRIGDDVTVTIAAVHGGRVKIGIQAPRHIAVLREEIQDGRVPQSGDHAVDEKHLDPDATH